MRLEARGRAWATPVLTALGLTADPFDKTAAFPKPYVMTIAKPLGLTDRLLVGIGTDMAPRTDDAGSIPIDQKNLVFAHGKNYASRH
jgi:hypothetical protein